MRQPTKKQTPIQSILQKIKDWQESIGPGIENKILADVATLCKDELPKEQQLISDVWDAAIGRYYHSLYGTVPESYPNKETYLAQFKPEA